MNSDSFFIINKSSSIIQKTGAITVADVWTSLTTNGSCLVTFDVHYCKHCRLELAVCESDIWSFELQKTEPGQDGGDLVISTLLTMAQLRVMPLLYLKPSELEIPMLIKAESSHALLDSQHKNYVWTEENGIR